MIKSATDALAAPAPSATEAQARGTAPVLTSGLKAPPLPPKGPSSIERAFQTLPVKSHTALVRQVHDNNEAWLAQWHILGSAEKRIDASYFILDRDVFGHAYLGALLRKQRDGIPVSLLLDASGDTFGRSGFTQAFHGQDYLQQLVRAGAHVRVYNPLYLKIPRQLAEPGHAYGIASNHDKILTTERYGMTGGRNIGAEYMSSRRDFHMPFHDSDVVVDGADAAAELRKAVHVEFDRNDINHVVQPVNLLSREAELLGAAAMMDSWLNRAALSEATRRTLRADVNAREPYAAALVRAAQRDLQKRGVEVTYLALENLHERAVELVGNPDLAGANLRFRFDENMQTAQVKTLDRTSNGAAPAAFDQIEPGLEKLIRASRGRVLITNPYIMLSERIRKALVTASRNGARIDLLTDSPTTGDNPLLQAFFQREWPRLMVRVPTLRVFVLNGDQRLHAKTVSFDGEVSMIGSSNLDLLSAEINGEIAEVIHSPEQTQRLEKKFRDDLKDQRSHIVEYKIARTKSGKPILRDGEPIITVGPNNHVPPGEMIQYPLLWDPMSRVIDQMPIARDTRIPPLTTKP